jgi:hypothetical protein
VLASHGVEGALQFAGVLYLHGLEVYAQCGRRDFYHAEVRMHYRSGRIPKDSQEGCLGNGLDDQLGLFRGYVRACIERYPGNVSPRMRQALDEPLANRITLIKTMGIDAVASLAA